MAVASPFFHSLSLEHFGLEWIQPPAAVVHPLGGEPPAMFERSLDASLSTLSPDESNYRRLVQPLLRDWQSLISEILAPSLHLPSHPFAMLNFGRHAIRSAAALNRLCFRDERARALFAGLASHSITSLELAGSSAVGLVMALTAHAVRRPFPRCARDRLYDSIWQRLLCERDSNQPSPNGYSVVAREFRNGLARLPAGEWLHKPKQISGCSPGGSMLQVSPRKKVYDVCIIGSGAGGGTAAKVLTEGGLSVVMLEAGPRLNPVKDFKEHVWPYQLAHRGVGEGGRLRGFLSEFMAPNGYWEVPGEPYTTAPGSSFAWFRSRIEGGRTNHWGRIALRFGPADFRPHSTDGMGDDWPITYEELAPYYDKVESYIGVFGSKENIPNAPDGVFLPPPKPRCTETLVKKACDRLNITCIPSRLAILTKSLNDRGACHYCGQCGRGCISASNFSSSQVMIPPAAATGRFTMIAGAMAREIVLGRDGKAEAVSYTDKATNSEQRVYARAIIVAASACESARLLLNSRSSSFPTGLANSSGVVGRYLTDSVGSRLVGQFPQLEKVPPHNHDGVGGMHMYMPWWLFGKKNDFLRGYHIEMGGGRDMPGVGQFTRVCDEHEGYGVSLKQACRKDYGTHIGFSGRGEMIPNEDSFCEIDPSVKDQWGIPVLRFHWKWGENELKMSDHMQATFRSIIETAGGTVVNFQPRTPPAASAGATAEQARQQPQSGSRISTGGEIIHELGTVRMGNNPKTSALNRWCQAHDVKNVFVADAAPFVSNPDKNPTLTIMALSWRTSEYLLDQVKKGEI